MDGGLYLGETPGERATIRTQVQSSGNDRYPLSLAEGAMMRSMMIAALLGATALSSNGAMAQRCGQQRGRLAIIPYEPMTIYECTTSPDVATSIVASSGEKVGPNSAPDTDALDLSTSA